MMAPRVNISPDLLRNIIDYNPDTGRITWKVRADRSPQWNGRYAHSEALNNLSRHGYFRGTINNRLYLAHRVAFAFVYGRWPHPEVDHINGNRRDNRIANLREVPKSQNAKNKRPSRRNSSGHNGIHWDSRNKKWIAQVKRHGQSSFLGRFKRVEDAIAARDAAYVRYGYHENHGKPAEARP